MIKVTNISKRLIILNEKVIIQNESAMFEDKEKDEMFLNLEKENLIKIEEIKDKKAN